jgi:hypothetical protein
VQSGVVLTAATFVGYTAVGLLDADVVTSVWCQQRLKMQTSI